MEAAPGPDLLELQRVSFADYEASREFAEVLASEAAARSEDADVQNQSQFGVTAFRGDRLIGWSQGYREGKNHFYMLNSGVAIDERRKGVYTQLVKAVLAHAKARGYGSVRSRHTAANNAVIVAKLRLGFQVSGFEYSEVYGPLVQLTYLVSEERRKFYKNRASPIRPVSS